MFNWFSTNHLAANAGKCHLLTCSKTPVDVHISNTEILSEEKVKSLGVIFESRFNFDFHENTVSKKVSKRYHTLARVHNYINKKKRCIFFNALSLLTSYCPLVWMSNSSTMNNRINKVK